MKKYLVIILMVLSMMTSCDDWKNANQNFTDNTKNSTEVFMKIYSEKMPIQVKHRLNQQKKLFQVPKFALR